jgi:Glycosyl transferase family 2
MTGAELDLRSALRRHESVVESSDGLHQATASFRQTLSADELNAPPEPASRDALIQDEVLQRLADLERRLRDTQALTARTYESLQNWPSLLDEIRRDSHYEESFVKSPLITVRIATYNAADLLLGRAIRTLRAQSYDNWEAIIVGDANTDDTEVRVAALEDERIRYFNLPSRGPYPDDPLGLWYVAGTYGMNAGSDAARGAWIAPLDHDDEWEEDHLEVLLSAAQRERAEVVYGRIRVLDETNGTSTEMGAWPPARGDFGFLGALYHAGLARFRYDQNCRFADEPGDWNLARRMWDAGVTFYFLDRVVATQFFTPRHDTATFEQRTERELRKWIEELEAARDWWQASAEELRQWAAELEKARDWWQARAEAASATEPAQPTAHDLNEG